MVGRLDIDEETWKPFSEGRFTSYEYHSDGSYTIHELGQTPDVEDRNMARLAAGLGFNRFTERLNDYTDLSKIIYVYGDRDEEVGPLSEREIRFLDAKGANLILSENSDHSDAAFTGIQILKRLFEGE